MTCKRTAGILPAFDPVILSEVSVFRDEVEDPPLAGIYFKQRRKATP